MNRTEHPQEPREPRATLRDPALRRLRARLERWELDHLRQLAAEQAEQIEELQRRLSYAEDCARSWQEDVFAMQEALESPAGASHRCVGLTQSGALLVVATGAVQ